MHSLPTTYLKIEDTKNLLTELDLSDIHFDHPVQVVISPTFVLMVLWGVSIDANDRLWVRSNRKDEIEVNNSLLYSQFILSALNTYLNDLLEKRKSLFN